MDAGSAGHRTPDQNQSWFRRLQHRAMGRHPGPGQSPARPPTAGKFPERRSREPLAAPVVRGRQRAAPCLAGVCGRAGFCHPGHSLCSLKIANYHRPHPSGGLLSSPVGSMDSATARAARACLRGMLEKAGIAKKISPRQVRSTDATHRLRRVRTRGLPGVARPHDPQHHPN